MTWLLGCQSVGVISLVNTYFISRRPYGINKSEDKTFRPAACWFMNKCPALIAESDFAFALVLAL